MGETALIVYMLCRAVLLIASACSDSAHAAPGTSYWNIYTRLSLGHGFPLVLPHRGLRLLTAAFVMMPNSVDLTE